MQSVEAASEVTKEEKVHVEVSKPFKAVNEAPIVAAEHVKAVNEVATETVVEGAPEIAKEDKKLCKTSFEAVEEISVEPSEPVKALNEVPVAATEALKTVEEVPLAATEPVLEVAQKEQVSVAVSEPVKVVDEISVGATEPVIEITPKVVPEQIVQVEVSEPVKTVDEVQKIASTSTDQEEAVNLERNLQDSNENVVKCKKDVSKSMAKISRKEGVIDVPLTSSTVPASTDPASIDLTSSMIKSRLINTPNPLLYLPTPEERIIYIASAESIMSDIFNIYSAKNQNQKTLELLSERNSSIETIEVISCNPKEEPNYEIPVIETSDDDDGTALENVNEEISDINLNLEIRDILDLKSLKPAVSSNPVKVELKNESFSSSTNLTSSSQHQPDLRSLHVRFSCGKFKKMNSILAKRWKSKASSILKQKKSVYFKEIGEISYFPYKKSMKTQLSESSNCLKRTKFLKESLQSQMMQMMGINDPAEFQRVARE